MKAALFSAIMTLGSNPNADSLALLEVHSTTPSGSAVQRQLYTVDQYPEVGAPRLIPAAPSR